MSSAGLAGSVPTLPKLEDLLGTLGVLRSRGTNETVD